jgi:hypothetical protein
MTPHAAVAAQKNRTRMVLARAPIGNGTEVVITRQVDGRIDIRLFEGTGTGTRFATRRGLTVPATSLTALIAALTQARKEAA